MPAALHPQTPMAFRLSDDGLPTRYGYKLKIRIPARLGFRANPKFVTTLYVTNQRPKGFWTDRSITGSAGYDACEVVATVRSV